MAKFDRESVLPEADPEEALAAQPLAYVREIRADEIGRFGALPPGVTHLYAVHDENGRRLAVFDDRAAAFAIARQNSFAPVSAH
ncbi:DUF1150 family protein [Neomegalonema sp.]|uniref:DUF1150 family protein n=1 Tax=Neomegalonema sp. TaxID=2039713 RepID=UPI0026232EE2|nr:DUF1150 family protein [Neomegalonema sp.]MDD2869584.1 DUF1150 family protein [Neomegalonema sp.]